MKFFKPEEARALLPLITPKLQQLMALRREAAIALLEADVAARARSAGELRDPLVMQRATRDVQAQMIALIEAIQRHGCIVKDIDLGLIDFPALRGGQQINLCWKLGEPAIAYWHGADEGFAARKPLEQRRTT